MRLFSRRRRPLDRYEANRTVARFRGAAALLTALVLAGLVSAQAVAQAAGAAAPGLERFECLASWYGAQFHGRTTSSGEIYDKDGFTAAHRSLPFGTLLRVTSLDTGASVVVRVNDRGPFVAGRDLDLSEGAARILGMVATGTARVSCTVLPAAEAAAFGSPGPLPGAGSLAAGSGNPSPPGAAPSMAAPLVAAPSMAKASDCHVQVASYRDAKNAQATLERLRMAGLSPELEVAGPYTRVVFPRVPLAELEALSGRLRAMGYRDLLIRRPLGP